MTTDRKPFKLSCDAPRISKPGQEKLAICLAMGCSNCTWRGQHMSRPVTHTATMKRRKVGIAVTVYLQCDTCGGSIGMALARADHYFWQSYPEWDEGLKAQADEEIQASYRLKDEAAASENRYLIETRDERRDRYSEWLRTSPEWKSLRAFVVRRANMTCEGCLNRPATDVHHETYELGWLPPAWLLRAVCRACHERLHDGWRNEEST